MSSTLTHVKLLDERIEATMDRTRDERILLYLSMSLPDIYRLLTRMWSLINKYNSGKSTFHIARRGASDQEVFTRERCYGRY